MKYLVWGVLALFGWWVWRRLQAGKARRDPGNAADKAPLPPRAPEPMAACAHCGTHAPLSDMVQDDAGRYFCTPAHRSAARERGR